jgi:hypothetical protein
MINNNMENDNTTPLPFDTKLSGVEVKTGKGNKYIPVGGNGGAREGAGRKAGGQNKLTGKNILEAIFAVTGKPFEQQLAEGYYDSILNNDRALRQRYEQLILNKVVADKVDMDVTTMGESLHERKQAFERIVTTIGANHAAKKRDK